MKLELMMINKILLMMIINERQYGLYDLFAVCNHRGSMSNGHYTGMKY